jgi:predicted  nucleic acid-binding Zn-ribbon protein
MGDVQLSELMLQQQFYTNGITSLSSKITACERAYESLLSFQSVVKKSQEDFHSINSSKSNALSAVEEVKTNSKTAQKYATGMQTKFSGIGTKVVGTTYTVLLTAISAKLRSYTSSINQYETQLSNYQRKQSDIAQQIETLQTDA